MATYDRDAAGDYDEPEFSEAYLAAVIAERDRLRGVVNAIWQLVFGRGGVVLPRVASLCEGALRRAEGAPTDQKEAA